MRCFIGLLLVMSVMAEERAKNVILLLADAGGTSTLHAASVHGYGQTRKLYIQRMPHIGLSDTSTASSWVSDSAAGMTAIVTGRKTHNGVLSQSDTAVRGKSDGVPLKTILEYAEERGLATGVMTNVAAHDATPAACYSQVNDRRDTGRILDQFLKPRFGDGVDVLLGGGKKKALEVRPEFFAAAEKKGYEVLDGPAAIGAAKSARVVGLTDGAYRLGEVLPAVVEKLKRNRKGFFLMVEWDAHTTNPQKGLDNVVEFDKAIAELGQRTDLRDTLILFTADHSFDLRMVGGRRGEGLLNVAAGAKPALKVDGSHSGEEVLVAAQGPGASRVRGYMDNTDLFGIMLSAWGWKRE